jgi:metallo-beta-lactamase family protein
MPTSLSFLGAARTVTGSRHLLTADGRRVLVDCGLFQERELQERNWAPFQVPPAELDAVVLTHGHLDHCGLLPRLVAQGFRGTVHATEATAAIAPLVMLDSARLQEEDAATKAKRHAAEGRSRPEGYRPLYTVDEAEAAARRITGHPLRHEVAIAPGITASFHPAGHILGSAMVRLRAGDTSVLFSGDLGPGGNPLIAGPVTDAGGRNLVVESTYGDRVHDEGDVSAKLRIVLDEAWESGGNVVVPCFAIERAQEIIYRLGQLHQAGRLAPWRVFLDSPMAIKVLQVFRDHPEACHPHIRASLADAERPFGLPGLTLCSSRDESKMINTVRQGAIILAGSGMCTGGRVKHHLDQHLGRADSTVLFVGYQASGTLGRQILDGSPQVRLFGRLRDVHARVRQVRGFSGHADQRQVLAWATALTPQPERAFVVHGGATVTQTFAGTLAAATGWPCVAPEWGQEIAI